MRLFIVRHGETAWNVSGAFRGNTDVPLTDEGLRQAELVAGRLAGEGIARVVSSPLSRALRTAGKLAASLDVKVEVDGRLANVDYGTWAGQLETEVAAEEPELYAAWKAEPAAVRFPQGTGIAEVYDRALPVARELAGGGADTAIVTHQVVARLLTLGLQGRPANDFWKLKIDTGAFNLFNCEGGECVLEAENEAAHLAGP